MEQIKLSQEELDTLNQLQETQNNIPNSLGQIEYSIQLLELQKEQLVNSIEELKQTESKIGKDLMEKYGNGSIDLNLGTFTKTEPNLETS